MEPNLNHQEFVRRICGDNLQNLFWGSDGIPLVRAETPHAIAFVPLHSPDLNSYLMCLWKSIYQTVPPQEQIKQIITDLQAKYSDQSQTVPFSGRRGHVEAKAARAAEDIDTAGDV